MFFSALLRSRNIQRLYWTQWVIITTSERVSQGRPHTLSEQTKDQVNGFLSGDNSNANEQFSNFFLHLINKTEFTFNCKMQKCYLTMKPHKSSDLVLFAPGCSSFTHLHSLEFLISHLWLSQRWLVQMPDDWHRSTGIILSQVQLTFVRSRC